MAVRGVAMHVQGLQGTQIRVVGNGATEAVVVEIPNIVGWRAGCDVISEKCVYGADATVRILCAIEMRVATLSLAPSSQL